MKIIIKFLYLLFFVFILCDLNNYESKYVIKEDNEYLFKLIVPNINLSANVYRFESDKNNVNKGIYLAVNYNFESSDKAIVLASHSGNSDISYFKNLDNLNIGDYVYIKKENLQYSFKLENIYKINKNGKFRYINEKGLIYLITCDKKNNKKQIVFQGKIEKIDDFY